MDYDSFTELAHVTLLGVAGVAILITAIAWLSVGKACRHYGRSESATALSRGEVFRALGVASTATGVALLLGMACWMLRGH